WTSAGRQLIAPHITLAIQPVARGEFPLRFGGQAFARLFAAGDRVVPRDVHDGMLLAPADVRVRPFGVTPVRAGDVAPPDEMVLHGIILERFIAGQGALTIEVVERR